MDCVSNIQLLFCCFTQETMHERTSCLWVFQRQNSRLWVSGRNTLPTSNYVQLITSISGSIFTISLILCRCSTLSFHSSLLQNVEILPSYREGTPFIVMSWSKLSQDSYWKSSLLYLTAAFEGRIGL